MVSNSQLEKFSQCPRKYTYQYRVGLADPVGPPAVYSRTVLHPSLADMYRASDLLGSKIAERFERYKAEVGFAGVAKASGLTLALAEKICGMYRASVARDQEEYEIVAVEEGKEIELTEGETYYSRPDVVLQRRSDGVRVVVDFKFSMSDFVQRQISILNAQFLGQAFVWDAPEVMVVTIVPGARGKLYIERQILRVSADHKRAWLDETRAQAWYLQECDRLGVWPKRHKACWDYNQQCHFLSLCEAGALAPNLYSSFEQKPAYREEER